MGAYELPVPVSATMQPESSFIVEDRQERYFHLPIAETMTKLIDKCSLARPLATRKKTEEFFRGQIQGLQQFKRKH